MRWTNNAIDEIFMSRYFLLLFTSISAGITRVNTVLYDPKWMYSFDTVRIPTATANCVERNFIVKFYCIAGERLGLFYYQPYIIDSGLNLLKMAEHKYEYFMSLKVVE